MFSKNIPTRTQVLFSNEPCEFTSYWLHLPFQFQLKHNSAIKHVFFFIHYIKICRKCKIKWQRNNLIFQHWLMEVKLMKRKGRSFNLKMQRCMHIHIQYLMISLRFLQSFFMVPFQSTFDVTKKKRKGNRGRKRKR